MIYQFIEISYCFLLSSPDMHLNIFEIQLFVFATLWYQKHLGGTSQVLLVSNNRENKRKATEEGISAETSL